MELETWISIISAAGAVGSAIAAIVTVRATNRQIVELHRTMGAETYCQLEEKFYHTNLMRRLRKRAAEELLANGSQTFDAFDDLADFFDFVGTLRRRGVLDMDMTWNSYYARATAFWKKGVERNAISKVRDYRPGRWDDFEDLVGKMAQFEKREKKKDEMTPERINLLLEQEARLLPFGDPEGKL
jgi:hypothetical protein